MIPTLTTRDEASPAATVRETSVVVIGRMTIHARCIVMQPKAARRRYPTCPLGILCYPAGMPNALPADAVARLPKARMIDPRGHRFGAGVSAVLLIGRLPDRRDLARPARPAVDRGQRRIRPAVLDLWRRLAPHRQDPGTPQGRARARVPAALRAGPRQRRAHARPHLIRPRRDDPRLGVRPGGRRAPDLLATTGYCLGCRLYFLRWWVPDLVTRIWTRGRSRLDVSNLAPERINYR